LALPSGRRDRRRLAPGGLEGFSGNAFGPMMATFHRAAGDRRGALSKPYLGHVRQPSRRPPSLRARRRWRPCGPPERQPAPL